VPRQQLLGESLAALEFGGALVGAEDDQTVGLELVDEAGNQGLLRADDGEVDLFLDGEGEEPLDIMRRNVDADCISSDAVIAGRAVDLFDQRTPFHLPDQCVFTSPAADDQYSHSAPYLARIISILCFSS